MPVRSLCFLLLQEEFNKLDQQVANEEGGGEQGQTAAAATAGGAVGQGGAGGEGSRR